MSGVVFAIDLGNSYVKMKSGRAEYNYPAQYLMAENVLKNMRDNSVNYGNDCYQLKDDLPFIWGDQLDAYNLSDKMINTRAYSERYAQRKVQRLLEFAIAKLASDYSETKESELEVRLVLGVSIAQNHEKDKTKELLTTLCVGLHSCLVNGKEVKVLVKSAQDFLILPQYMGTLENLAFDQELKENKAIQEGKFGVLDIGSETLLLNTVTRMIPGVWPKEQLEGIKNIVSSVASKTNVTQSLLIEKLLFNEEETVYVNQIAQNLKEDEEILHVVKQEIQKYTAFVIAPFLTENFSNLDDIDAIFITGGGANLLSREVLSQEIGDNYFSHLRFIEEAELANVRGFYKYGLLSLQKEIASGKEKSLSKEKSESEETPVLRETVVQEDVISSEEKSHEDNHLISPKEEEAEAELEEVLSNIEKLKENMDALKENKEETTKDTKDEGKNKE